ncbi:MAG: hypothetical protein AMS21_00890 [Gemmatimonas sp. SG8_38_2]|nr:MAG: hypothetical protein AMS21_00890 [Gemmatimonas sp. SG8_38_2]
MAQESIIRQDPIVKTFRIIGDTGKLLWGSVFGPDENGGSGFRNIVIIGIAVAAVYWIGKKFL